MVERPHKVEPRGRQVRVATQPVGAGGPSVPNASPSPRVCRGDHLELAELRDYCVLMAPDEGLHVDKKIDAALKNEHDRTDRFGK